ncbi:paraquat-inducible protein A [Roseovarius sp. SCSIO 43702]|uniref:paraquat-inducible protein A n=1 Tax=Roseovarius sp. SCSIO 43702 TaxID=2823043 RepID=UPI001C72A789|nr:paraquat-inducible protein A [Roseovarius sp. SCSIO 43702]QYX57216.1 paraquat-inducible protein A [Roseovarius sp. SCSIO 43702]
MSERDTSAIGLEKLIACPHCDAVYEVVEVAPRERAVCVRCHTVLIAPRRKAGKQIIALATAVLILIIAAMLLPFLSIDAGGLEHRASILTTAFSFTGPLTLLSLVVLGFIVVIPMLRLTLLVYVLGPVVQDRPPARYAAQAFRVSEALRPWSMAEVFAIGCAVALVKLGDLAQIHFGPAFWMFTALVIIVVATDMLLCRYSIWKSLET